MDYLRLKRILRIDNAIGCLIAASGFMWPLQVRAAPLLHCNVSYAGIEQTVETRPVADAYSVPSIDVGERFRFKAVMVGTENQIDRIVLYTYLETRRQPVLVHMAKYLPPFSLQQGPLQLTGDQFVYAGPVERELQYRCTLQGINS